MKFLSNFPLCNLLPSNTFLISSAKIRLFAYTAMDYSYFIHENCIFLIYIK